MTTWLLVALAANAQLAILCGVFLAGSLRKRDILWGTCVATMGIIILSLLLVSSVDSLPSPLGFNPARVAQAVFRGSDASVVVKGVLIGIPVPILAFAGVMFVLRNARQWYGPATAGLFASVLLAIFLATTLTATSAAVPHLGIQTVMLPREDISGGLTVPAGFQIKAFLPQGINKITSIAIDSKDRLFVASQNGVVVTVDDANDDGVGDDIVFFMSKDGAILGITVSNDGRTLFIAGGGDVIRAEDNDRDGTADFSTTIIDGLPSFVYVNHSNNGLVIGPDGRLYMTVGGTSSTGPENEPLAGTILVANLDGSDLQVYARGLRNPYDLTFTSSGLLVASDNGPEGLEGGNPDELNIIEEGGHYGYPDIFGDPPPGSGTIGPIYMFPDHSVPTGKIAYVGEQFPLEYRDRIFVALFKQLDESKVVSITLVEDEAGEIRGVAQDFATGFRNAIDVAIDSRGRIYIADYSGGQVYQVSWIGLN